MDLYSARQHRNNIYYTVLSRGQFHRTAIWCVSVITRQFVPSYERESHSLVPRNPLLRARHSRSGYHAVHVRWAAGGGPRDWSNCDELLRSWNVVHADPWLVRFQPVGSP